jgi:hypothetical protein
MNATKAKLREQFPHAWRWISVSAHIGGWLSDAEANAIFELARFRTPERDAVVVELGSWQGKSSVLLAAGLCGKSNARLFAIDPFGVDEGPHHAQYYGPLLQKMRLSVEETFHRNIRRCGVASLVTALKGYSHEVVKSWTQPIDLLFIDANHEYESVYRDFMLWSPFVRDGGIVVLHDVAPIWPGPTQVMQEEMLPPDFEQSQQVDSLAWAVRRVGTVPEPLSAADREPIESLVQALDRATGQIAVFQTSVTRLTAELIEQAESGARLAVQLDDQREENARLKAERARLAAAEKMRAAALAPNPTRSPRLTTILGRLGKTRGKPFINLLQWLQYRRLVDASGLFDRRYYLAQNPDVEHSGIDPLRHFFLSGADEIRNPHPLFDVSYYLGRNPDVAQSTMNPLVHYLKSGALEGRDPHPEFDSSFYLESNPEVRTSGTNPLVHYIGPGVTCGLDPNPGFDTTAYLESHPEAALQGLNPLVHYLDSRWQEWRSEVDAENHSAASPAAALAWPRGLYRANALPVSMRLDPRKTQLRESLRREYLAAGSRDLGGEYNSAPLVSVIIPCLNYGYYLEDAILSAIRACSHPLEILVVDDGSTDETSIAIVQELARQYRFRLLRQDNAGQAAARFNAFRNSRGKYIQFLDADDFLAPGKIDFQIDMLSREPEVDIAVCEYQLCDADGEGCRLMKPSTLAGFSFSIEDFLLRWERGFSLPIHCALFRREVLDRRQFQCITKKGKEDWIFWIVIAAGAPRFRFHPEVLATYRIHGHNTYTNREAMGLDFLRGCMYVLQAGLSPSDKFLEASVEHFRTAYLASIKSEATVGSRSHP